MPAHEPLERREHDPLDDEPDRDVQQGAGEDPLGIKLVAVLVV